ncbi:MAG TPA: MFS transporter [Moraxellaceae bacterium]|nr:MFS transporter [Moraxellaceae bacterium]
MTALPLPPDRERPLVLLLASIQFCHIVDFMVLMPLGPQLMRLLLITPAQFGLLVSAYTLAAGLTGFAFSFFADRFDRRPLLLGLFAGFLVATLACGLATGFGTLLAARLLAGAFGGILGANVIACLGDTIPEERRGAATGRVMAAFSVAAIAGVPLGLFLAVHFSWRAAFLMVGAAGVPLGLAAMRILPSIPARHSGALDMSGTLRQVFGVANHRWAFALIGALMLAGFSVIPFISPFMVRNVGLGEADLPYIYLAGGLATLISAPLIGRQADLHGKAKTARWVAALSVVPIFLLTHLPRLPLPWVLVVSTLFMVFVSGRLIPAMALVTAASAPALRGRFLTMNAALQQLSASAAAFLPTLVLAEGSSGQLMHYDIVGYGAIAMTLVSIWLAGKIEVRS